MIWLSRKDDESRVTKQIYRANVCDGKADKPRTVTDKVDAILEKLEQDRHISSYYITEKLEIDHKTVLIHLQKKKLDLQRRYLGPKRDTGRNVMNCVLVCDSLLKRNETEPFMKRLITGDESWITYDKYVRKRSWSKDKRAVAAIGVGDVGDRRWPRA
ncbi:Histone-lysine N-methyltransferase SETMAR [Eumeta japonica]|uniref:Histone-lysine N-methyltransferase SETMAR n=1 Tax=Eumeta variegata TaxID=151549 RepID=A0A4C1SQT9_EUMVA|nr:Histone-lysine N-methyltransferase SETMAR [Eumeta japonica]